MAEAINYALSQWQELNVFIAVVCSPPPEGRARWTVRLLTEDEVVVHTDRSQKIIIDISERIAALRSTASSAIEDMSVRRKQNLASAELQRKQVDKTLQAFNGLDQELRSKLSEAFQDSQRLSADINRAVNGMQFQDRVNQRLDHVVQALDDCCSRLSEECGDIEDPDTDYIDDIINRYTMHEERTTAGGIEDKPEEESIELF